MVCGNRASFGMAAQVVSVGDGVGLNGKRPEDPGQALVVGGCFTGEKTFYFATVQPGGWVFEVFVGQKIQAVIDDVLPREMKPAAQGVIGQVPVYPGVVGAGLVGEVIHQPA